MAYSEELNSNLKNIFKFYKLLDYTQDVCKQICLYAESVLKTVCVENPFNLHDDKCTVEYLPNENFFILKNFLSENEIDALLLAALTEWCYLPSAESNLNTTVDVITNSKKISTKNPWYCKLRWVTLGYHYQWSDRTYDQSKVGEFPSLLNEITVHVVNFLRHLIETEKCRKYKPEASIVNYYRTKTTMGFHSDDAELDKEAPLVSISIGPTALFLLETSEPIDCQNNPVHEFTNSNTILPVFLQHGDVVIMAGKSRLARHAVPNIFFNDIPNVVLETAQRVSHKVCESVVHEKGNDSCLHCQEFLQYATSTRINMNVRQVMPVNE
ncbi:unnamed protein product [Trichobilharzia szidati]|nr:unnamed protein product [Trichobilharzia szidati]